MRNKMAIIALVTVTLFGSTACLFTPIGVPLPPVKPNPPTTVAPKPVPERPAVTVFSVNAPTEGQVEVYYRLGNTNGAVTKMEYSVDGGQWLTAQTNNNSFVIAVNPATGQVFQPGIRYSVSLRVSNANGASPVSTYRTFTIPIPLPAMPKIDIESVSTDSVDIFINETLRAESFVVVVVDPKIEVVVSDTTVIGSSGRTTITGLSPSTEYILMSSAVNLRGRSYPTIVNFTTKDVPSQPEASTTVEGNTVTLTLSGLPSGATGWIAMAVEEGADLSNVSDENIMEIETGVTVWENIEPGTYTLVVSYYTGDYSNSVVVLNQVITIL